MFDQTRYERAVEAYRLLIELDPNGGDAPDHQKRDRRSAISCWATPTGAVAEMRKLAGDYGPRSAWAAANKDRPKAVAHARTMAEELIRNAGQDDARRGAAEREAEQGRRQGALRARRRGVRVLSGELPRRAPTPPSCATCAPTSSTSSWASTRTPGDEYLAVGKTKPRRQVPQGRAAAGDDRVREGAQAAAAGGGKREITDSDRQFAEAADLYATLFPKDKEIVTVIYKNGQFFFDYGDYDEAVKRFGLIVERYPDDPNAGAGGRSHPGGADQGQGLREHRDVGAAAEEDQGVRVQGRAGAPGQADRRWR